MPTEQPLYPLRFQEILRHYGFGARWIAETLPGKELPPDVQIAETWEVCNRPSESSYVINGPLRGETLHTVIETYSDQLLGHRIVARYGTRFPLLIKFLDISHSLAEQTHHSDELAARRGLEDPGKTEAWYVLRARPGATVYVGNKPNVTREEVQHALRQGTVKDLMQIHEVSPGDTFLLYPGTMHYVPGGVLLYEIMQNSDVYISLRSPDPTSPPAKRERLIAEALEGIHLETPFDASTQPVILHSGANTRSFLLACRHFALEKLVLTEPMVMRCDGMRFYVLSLIDGNCTVAHETESVVLHPGHTVLLPASLGLVSLVPHQPSTLLKAYVPNLLSDIVQPLRRLGYPDTTIAALGGHTVRNDLLSVLAENPH